MPVAQADVLENRFLGNFLLIYDNLVVLKILPTIPYSCMSHAYDVLSVDINVMAENVTV